MQRIEELMLHNNEERNYILQVDNFEKNTSRFYIFFYNPKTKRSRIFRIRSIGTLLDYIDKYEIKTREIIEEEEKENIISKLYCSLLYILDDLLVENDFEGYKVLSEFKLDKGIEMLEPLTPDDLKNLFNTYHIENKNFTLKRVHLANFNNIKEVR